MLKFITLPTSIFGILFIIVGVLFMFRTVKVKSTDTSLSDNDNKIVSQIGTQTAIISNVEMGRTYIAIGIVLLVIGLQFNK